MPTTTYNTRSVPSTTYGVRQGITYLATEILDYLMTEDDNYLITDESVYNEYGVRGVITSTYSVRTPI